MELTLIIAGLVFLCNPMIAILDILPDFIGIGLILLGLNRLSAISPKLDDSRPYFRYMLLTSLARLVVFFASNTFDGTMTLSITLVFAVIEFGLAMMAMPALYEGLSFLNIRYSGSAKETPEFKTVSIVFFAIRGFLSLLPMLGLVMTNPDDELITSPDQVMSDWSEYTLILTIVNVVITLIFAIFWMVIVTGYIGKLSKDNSFTKEVNAAYEQKKRDFPEFFTRRTLLYTMVLMNIGAFFLIDLIGDGINIIPDFIFGGFMIAVICLIKKYSDPDKFKPAFISAIAYTAVSLANFISHTVFMKNRFFAPYDKLLSMFPSEYITAVIFALADGIAIAIFARYIFEFLKPIAERETTPEVPENFVKTALDNEKFKRNSVRILSATCIIMALTGLTTVCLTALTHFFPEIWMINLFMNILFFVLISVVETRFTNGIKRRYSSFDDV